MHIFLASLLLIGIAFLAMSLGVIFGRPALRGSCGGIGQPNGAACPHCATGCGGGAGEAGKEQAGISRQEVA